MESDQIKNKMRVGDYVLAAEILNTTPENVRTRFARNKEDVIMVLKEIIDNRDKFIKECKSKLEKHRNSIR